MADWGACACHGAHGLAAVADSLDGICGECRGRSPAECARVHGREEAAGGDPGRLVLF